MSALLRGVDLVAAKKDDPADTIVRVAAYAGLMIRRRVVVHGRVQAVGFRYEARIEAQRLGITGWIRNRSDGAVETEIEGDAASVDAMLAWLDEGPPGADVTSISTADIEPTGERGFRVTG